MILHFRDYDRIVQHHEVPTKLKLHWCMQEAEFAAAFLLGIPGGHFDEQQNRWVLPVSCHELLYTPRLLALMLLLALTHLPAKRTNSPAAAETGVAQPLDAFPSSSDHTAPCVTDSCLQQQLVPDCSVCKSSRSASSGKRAPASSSHQAATGSSEALCEGLEEQSRDPELLAPHADAQAGRVRSSHGTSSATASEHAPPNLELTDIEKRLAWVSGGDLGYQHAMIHASSPDMLAQTLAGKPQIDRTLQKPGMKAICVWVALTHARQDLMLETQRLRTSRQEQVPDFVAVLSSMLQKFSADVLWSQHLRLAAEAAVALSTSTAPTYSTELTGDDRMQPQTIPSYTEHLQGPRTACMNIMHAHGIMHAVGQVMASSCAAGGAIKLHSQVPGTEGGGTGEVQQQWVLKKSSFNLESNEDVVVKGTAVQDVAPRATSEMLLQNHILNDLTWQKVCLKLCLQSQEYLYEVPIRPFFHVVVCSSKRST
jgi:hypothetical protein